MPSFNVSKTYILASFLFVLADYFFIDNGKANCPSVGKGNLEINNSKLDVSSNWQSIKLFLKNGLFHELGYNIANNLGPLMSTLNTGTYTAV